MGNVTTVMKQGRRHTRQASREIVDRWPIYWMWINGAEGHHAAGRAVDLMTLTADQRRLRNAVGNEIAAYTRKHHRRLGVQYVIWRQRIWNATRSSDANRIGWSTWRTMEDRGSASANHLDHVHISFLDRPPGYRAPGAGGAAGRSRPAGEEWHTVRRGETLTAIAAAHRTTVRALVRWNRIAEPDLIRVGQKLVVRPRTARRRPARYTVKAGDTLSAIASRYGTTVRVIAERNRIADPDRIRVGQQLLIPR